MKSNGCIWHLNGLLEQRVASAYTNSCWSLLVFSYVPSDSNEWCMVLSWISFSEVPFLCSSVAPVALRLWFVLCLETPASEHIFLTFCCSVCLPSGTALYHGRLGSSGFLSIDRTYGKSFCYASGGSLLMYKSRTWTGHFSWASGQAQHCSFSLFPYSKYS